MALWLGVQGQVLVQDSLRRVVHDEGMKMELRLDALSRLQFTFRFSNLDSAAYLADSLIRFATEQGSGKYLHDALTSKALIYKAKVQGDSAIYVVRKALTLVEETENLHQQAHDYCLLGTVYEDLGNLDSAIVYYKKCNELGELADSGTANARSLLNLGFVYRIRGEYGEAIQYLFRARSICQQYRLTAYYPSISLNIGDIHHHQGDKQAAIDEYRRGIAEASSLNNMIRKAQLLIRMADVQSEIGQIDSALMNLDTCLAIGQKVGMKSEVAGAEIALQKSI